MRISGRIFAAGMALALAACASAPAAPSAAPTTIAPIDVSFAWGCWVSKDEPGGRITGFLRLLKDGPDGKVYQGYLHDVRGSDMIPLLHLKLARDGTRASVIRSGETIEFVPNAPTATSLQFRSVTPGHKGSVSISGGNDQLSLSIQIGSTTRTFIGERDGCD